MKIEAFITLQTVLRKGSMAAAAKELSMTPSAVSMQIKQVESYLGRQLFDRSGLQARPLPIAREVADAVGYSLSQLETFKRQTTIVVEGTIRLGVIDSMQPVLLPGAMSRLRQRYPALRVHPTRGKSAILIDAVKAGTLDAAVVGQPETGGSGRLHWHPLLRTELSLIVPPFETETSLKTLFRLYEWIRYDRKTVAGRMSARYLSKHAGPHSSTIELDEVRAIVAMVSAGLGISIVQLSEPSICMTYPVNVLRLTQAPVLQFSLVTRRAEADSRPLRALRDAFDAVVSEKNKGTARRN
jgi:DNA-binding transcriptional LysR family regulator